MTPENVAQLDLNPVTAIPLIREVAGTSEKVFVLPHAEERMTERGISRTQVLRCLKNGHITEGPAQDMKGCWKFRIEVLSAGDPITVIASLCLDENGNRIVVITAYK